MHALLIETLAKSYDSPQGQKHALKDVELEVKQGSIFGLLGPNGAGKSTLINILAGVVLKTSGKASVMGYDITTHRKSASKNLGVVPQEIVVDNFFSLWQTLEFTAGYYGIRPAFRKTEEILWALGLHEKRNAFPRQLSGGMKRRFLIAKAVVHSPKVLILDEPTAGVDIELREQMWEYIRDLNRTGTTVIITTHYMQEAESLCDNIAFIDKGQVIARDTTTNLLASVGTRFIDVEFTSAVPIGAFDDIDSELLKENSLRFIINEKSGNIAKILDRISSNRLQARNITTHQADLEAVFKKYVFGGQDQI